MKKWASLNEILPHASWPGLRTKLIVLLILVMAVPLLVSSWLARNNAQSMGKRVSKQTTAMTEEMRETVTAVGSRTITDAIRALELLSREKIERLSTDVAREIAAFLYDRDDDIRLAARLDLTEESFRHFLAHRTREVIDHGPWRLAPDRKSWIPADQSFIVTEKVRPVLRENQIGFHYRPPETRLIKTRRPVYLEITFLDLNGMERVKITASPLVSEELRDVSRKENTYCKAETYFQELRALGDEDIYVSSVIGPYVASRLSGPYLPGRTKIRGIPFEPEESGYAGQENPVGKLFKGLVRWATPVIREGRRIGYITLALDHTHLMAFTNHLVPTEERYTALPNAQTGNYAFMADFEGKIIAHPRQYHIMGYDPATGKEVPPWMDTEMYAKWKNSGEPFADFAKEVPVYDEPSRYKTPSVEQMEAGQMGIDYRYLNFAPQCLGFQTITERGGSGSFHLFWSGLWKLNATAAIPYYTGRYGSQRRGFGHVGITANVQEFHSPALATKEYIDRFIAERDADLARDQQELSSTISESVADSIRKLSQSTGIMLAIVIGLAAWIASALRNRVATVTRGVREFQKGNLDLRLEVKSRDELSQLATAFNQMAQSIEASYVKLGKSEQRFRAIFNQTFQLTGFLSPDGTLLAANAAMLQFAGAAESELVDKPCWALPRWEESTELQRQVREAVGKAAQGEFLRFEASSPGEGGGTSFFDFSLKPFEDDGGYVVNLVLEARDITELKQAEHELRRHRDQLEFIVRERTHDLTLANEQLHREILERKQAEYKVRAERDRAQRYLDIAGAIIVLIDARQRTALINKKGCEVLGYDEKELVGKNWFDTVLPLEDREMYRELFAALLANENKSVEYVENTVLTKDGQPLTVAWQNSVLTDMNGKPVGTLISGVDITERKKAERELRRARDAAEVANRAKSTFLANISHEIRTPLNAILGFCQLLLRDSSITAKQRESLETINRSGEHLLALINEVLEMSKIESGCSSLNPVNFDLYRLLEDVEMMFRVRTETKGLQFEVSTSGDLPRYVIGDQGKIRQVLINLLGNAVKFTEHGGVILRVFSGNGDTPTPETTVGDSPAHGAMKLVLEVEDTGVGINEQDMEKVFQPFEQVGSGENGEGGTGLGLAISREFVGVMGGTISVASREGQGSAFRIAIPIRPGNEKADNGRDRKRRVIALEPGQPRFRILVVDDIQTNRDILCSMLIAVGLDVRTADNGEQAVATFDRWRPHAVLMDMKMPVMDGRQATRAIRARPGGKQTVVIAVSAGAWEEEIKDVLAEGPDDFIRKPFREEDLLDALRDHLGIKFRYEQDDREGRIGDPSEMKRPEVGPDTFGNLPMELIDEIVDATISLDVDRLTGLVPRVRAENPSAAVAMSRLLKQYEFEALLDALEVREEAV